MTGHLVPLAGLVFILLILGCGGGPSRPEDVVREFYERLERFDTEGMLVLVCPAGRGLLATQNDLRVLTGLGDLAVASGDQLTLEDFSLRIARSDEETAVVQIAGRLRASPASVTELPGEVYMRLAGGSWCITSDAAIGAELSSESSDGSPRAARPTSTPPPPCVARSFSPVGFDDAPLLSVESASETIRPGETFVTEVVVERVEHLAGFAFELLYCTDSIEFVDARDGPFLTSGSRRDRICSDSYVDDLPDNFARVTFECRTLGPPVSSGGQTGAEGSGVVAVLRFKALESGPTGLVVDSSTLVADDLNLRSLQPNDHSVVEIPHAKQGLNIDIQ